MADKPTTKASAAAAAAAPAAEETAAAPRKPSAILSIVKAVAFVSILVIVQVVGASMFIPSAQDTEKLAKQYVAATEGESAAAELARRGRPRRRRGRRRHGRGRARHVQRHPFQPRLELDAEHGLRALRRGASNRPGRIRAFDGEKQGPRPRAGDHDAACGRGQGPLRRRVGLDQTPDFRENQPRARPSDAPRGAVQQIQLCRTVC